MFQTLLKQMDFDKNAEYSNKLSSNGPIGNGNSYINGSNNVGTAVSNPSTKMNRREEKKEERNCTIS